MSILNFTIPLFLYVLHLLTGASAAAAVHRAPKPLTAATLNVGNGTTLAYIDSGAPGSSTTYTTIFAIHGMGFYSRKSINLFCITILGINRLL